MKIPHRGVSAEGVSRRLWLNRNNTRKSPHPILIGSGVKHSATVARPTTPMISRLEGTGPARRRSPFPLAELVWGVRAHRGQTGGSRLASARGSVRPPTELCRRPTPRTGVADAQCLVLRGRGPAFRVRRFGAPGKSNPKSNIEREPRGLLGRGPRRRQHCHSGSAAVHSGSSVSSRVCSLAGNNNRLPLPNDEDWGIVSAPSKGSIGIQSRLERPGSDAWPGSSAKTIRGGLASTPRFVGSSG